MEVGIFLQKTITRCTFSKTCDTSQYKKKSDCVMRENYRNWICFSVEREAKSTIAFVNDSPMFSRSAMM